MTPVHGTAPTAQGSLEQVPFAHLLVYMAEKRLSGTIVLARPGAPASEESMIHFTEGDVTQVRLANGSADPAQCALLPDETRFAFFEGSNLLPAKDMGRGVDPLAT